MSPSPSPEDATSRGENRTASDRAPGEACAGHDAPGAVVVDRRLGVADALAVARRSGAIR